MKAINVLLADDNRNFISAFQFILNNIEGETKINRIYTANNGEECMDIVKNEKIDLVFIDADMPKMDGAETTRNILKLNKLIRIVGLSFHNEADYIHKMINAGAINYIKKDSLNLKMLQDELKMK